MKYVLLFLCTFNLGLRASAQITPFKSYFYDAVIQVDSSSYSLRKDAINNELPFEYKVSNAVAQVYLYFNTNQLKNGIELRYSSDYDLLDSMLITKNFARFKVRFKNLNVSDYLKFTFKLKNEEGDDYTELPLIPFTNTYAKLYTQDDELFIGEEKIYELTSNFPDNIKVDNRWTSGKKINYRTSLSGKKLYIHLRAKALGKQELNADLTTIKPDLIDGQFNFQLPTLTHTFKVQKGRLAFLQFETKEVTPNTDNKVPVEVQIDNHWNLKLGHTYRIENQEEPGGALIAEIFTKNRLNNNKIMVLLRPYSYHRKSEGYLYIKKGDVPRFVTNLDITPRTKIKQISLQRGGKDWINTKTVYPGEIVNVKLTGEGLHKSDFSFQGVQSTTTDTLIQNEKIAIFKLRIPKDINSNHIEILNHGDRTNQRLDLKEYQKPKPFDFVKLEINNDLFSIMPHSNIYYEENIQDLTILFDREEIDAQKINGKQYLKVKIKIRGKNNNLIELYEFDQIVVCPGVNSPRHDYYDQSDCRLESIELNNVLHNKTYDLEEWSKIDIEVSHIRDKYKENSPSKKVSVVLKRRSSFDIDVSFPAGLLVLELGQNDQQNTFSNFGGISLAMIAQFSFYQPNKIAKYKPYKFGAGFIAIDAFNFSENSDRRDVGLVGIGSIYPSDKKRKLTFPLYAGFGYLLRKERAFFLIGPGIRVRL